MTPSLQAYIERRLNERDQISPARRETLQRLAGEVRAALKRDGSAELVFVCTHNSRRSQMAQVWAHAACRWFGIERVGVFSGGTEATAFYPGAIDALERAGLLIERGEGANPPVRVRTSPSDAGLICRSTLIDEAPNPDTGFIAVMTCAQADAACPIVPGAAASVPLRYEDPKSSDNTPRATEAYNERCAQIARELLHFGTMLASAPGS